MLRILHRGHKSDKALLILCCKQQCLKQEGVFLTKLANDGTGNLLNRDVITLEGDSRHKKATCNPAEADSLGSRTHEHWRTTLTVEEIISEQKTVQNSFIFVFFNVCYNY